MTSKCISVGVLLTAETLAMSLWFASAAVLPEMVREVDLTPARQALMTSAVQAGFVVGALAIAISGIADRLDPRRVFSVSALAAAAANASLLAVPVGNGSAVLLRAATGLLLAGVYPVGMKIIVGWGIRDPVFWSVCSSGP
jgi:nitrate/nitrite transporter NarK